MVITAKQGMSIASYIMATACAILAVVGCQPVHSPDPAAISAIQSYKFLVSNKEFGLLYDKYAHSNIKSSTTREEFVSRMEAGFDQTFQQLCDDILMAYKSGGLDNGQLYIGPMKYPTVDETVVVELTGRHHSQSAEIIQPGNAVRIQLAPENDVLRFYDID